MPRLVHRLLAVAIAPMASLAAGLESSWLWPWQHSGNKEHQKQDFSPPRPLEAGIGHHEQADDSGRHPGFASTQADVENPLGTVIDVPLNSELQLAPGVVSSRDALRSAMRPRLRRAAALEANLAAPQ
mmetsp:Transcript_18867/g.54572  ORF Transcript_18867/g.54572 Transcript_18867/m.54572 type:complete len:128 (+) Transcript_18867:101-484(+)